jgi:hypothetical protein
MIDNLRLEKPLPTGKVLEKVGYSIISEMPSRVTGTPGFKAALAELGLTDQFITSSLVEDIEKKPQNRLGELRLGAEILGITKRDDDSNTKTNSTTYNFIFSQDVQTKVRDIEDEIKKMLTNKIYAQNDEQDEKDFAIEQETADSD